MELGGNPAGRRVSRPAPWMARGGGPRIQAGVRAHRAGARCRVLGRRPFGYFWAFLYGPDTWLTGVRGHGGHFSASQLRREAIMPWNTRDAMSLKEEFVALARQPGSNKRELCRRFGISPQTAYKWLNRYETHGQSGLQEKSRKPATSPKLTPATLETEVLALRKEHPAWGGRTISNLLKKQIAPSTVTNVLRRHGLIQPVPKEQEAKHRFEHDAPNDLWQMDFKGHFATQEGRCHPLTLLDDHSRFNLAIQACENERGATVKEKIVEVFERFGLPARINVDNGPPWGSPRNPGEITELSIWLIRLGIRISFSRPYHPQTNGKIERFHRSLKAEVLDGRQFSTIGEAQTAFDRWRDIYNLQRPHQRWTIRCLWTGIGPVPGLIRSSYRSLNTDKTMYWQRCITADFVFRNATSALPKAWLGITSRYDLTLKGTGYLTSISAITS